MSLKIANKNIFFWSSTKASHVLDEIEKYLLFVLCVIRDKFVQQAGAGLFENASQTIAVVYNEENISVSVIARPFVCDNHM
ncbi:8598_t:CDS:2 [Rhizophagus irregularis]|nr:8598_t:CDS:2 [Rhizophagus irregularis]